MEAWAFAPVEDEFHDWPPSLRHAALSATQISTAVFVSVGYAVSFERLLLQSFAIASTLLFINYYFEGHLLAARMRFTILTTVALFRK